ncbi:MAG: ferritin-like domain-containing protein, partial [Gammaproteobacteria bacterium]
MHPRLRALQALVLSDPAQKVAATRALAADCAQAPPVDACWTDHVRMPDDGAGVPGRPARPVRVGAKDVPTRSPFTEEGRAALVHAICHIEFNAINLALDALWRFDGMPADYYRDWLRVADEEALHFTLIHGHLECMGWCYGDFPGHDGLWTMCEKTADDVVARMALVPRTLEA